MQRELYARADELKQQVHGAFDGAFELLRCKERCLLRSVDALTYHQQAVLWDSATASSSAGKQLDPARQGEFHAPVQSISLLVDRDSLSAAVDRFARIHVDGVVATAGLTSSLPSRLEDYGAEDHIVSHKPLPGDPSVVRVTRPPPLPNRNAPHTQSPRVRTQDGDLESVTSSGDNDKFELVSSPEESSVEIVRSPSEQLDTCCCAVSTSPSMDIESLTETDGAQRPSQGGDVPPVTPLSCGTHVQHPLADDPSAWLLTPSKQQMNSSTSVCDPLKDLDWSNLDSKQPNFLQDRDRWLLAKVCRANQSCGTFKDCVSSECEGLARLALCESNLSGKSMWLLGGGQTPSQGHQEVTRGQVEVTGGQMMVSPVGRERGMAGSTQDMGGSEAEGKWIDGAAIFAPFQQLAKSSSWLLPSY